MNVDRILETFNQHRVSYILIGGMNFLLRHAPVLTYDVDLWIDDTVENCSRCERALGALDAEWGASDDDWGPVCDRKPGWLARQAVFCLMSPSGPIDVFRSVLGFESWAECRKRAYAGQTPAGTAFPGLSDRDMLDCQLALAETQRKVERIRTLQRALGADRDA